MTITLNSLAFSAVVLRRSPNVVLATADKLGIMPAELRDGVPSFTDRQLDQIRDHLDGQKVEAANA